MRWTEGHIHVAMRSVLRSEGWALVAGEYPGGSDHELYPLCVVDPTVARDRSPDPRRHSSGELIPDILALRGRDLVVGEAKVNYSDADRIKLSTLLSDRRQDFLSALHKFVVERRIPDCLPVSSLVLRPTLIFRADTTAPPPTGEMSYLRIKSMTLGYFEGALEGVRT